MMGNSMTMLGKPPGLQDQISAKSLVSVPSGPFDSLHQNEITGSIQYIVAWDLLVLHPSSNISWISVLCFSQDFHSDLGLQLPFQSQASWLNALGFNTQSDIRSSGIYQVCPHLSPPSKMSEPWTHFPVRSHPIPLTRLSALPRLPHDNTKS